MGTLMLRGVLALLQMTILPGLIVMRHPRIPKGGLIQDAVYCFALSLVANYCLVFGLVALKIYHPVTVFVAFVLEVAAATWLYRSSLRLGLDALARGLARSLGGFVSSLQSGIQHLGKRDPVFGLGILFATAIAGYLSVDSLAWLVRVFRNNLGDIFQLWDAVVNWNQWAIMWTRNQIPNAYQYAQLIPINWSLTYVFLQNDQIQLFATAIMPLFALFTLLLFVDLALTFKRVGYLVALVATRYMMKKFAGGVIDDGYVDIAIMFFFFLPVHSLVKALGSNDPQSRRDYALVGALLAAGAAVTKPSGIYLLGLWPALCYILILDGRAFPDRRERTRLVARNLLISFLIAAPWYIVSMVMVARGQNVSSFVSLGQLSFYQASYLDRLANGILTIQKYNLLFAVSLLALPFLAREYRWLVLGAGLPYALLWCLFLGYDTRNLTPAIPIISLTAGVGLESIALKLEPLVRRLRLSSVKLLFIFGLLLVGLVVATTRLPDEALLARQDRLQRQLWYPQLNEQVYARLEQEPGGVILTNYRADFLPGVGAAILIDHLDDYDSFLELVADRPEIRTILLSRNVDQRIRDYVQSGLEQGSLHVVVEMGAWTMVGVQE